MNLQSFSRFLTISLALSAISAFAQETASVNGTVRDASGAVVPTAVVTLVNPKTNTRYSVKTNDDGVYRFTNVAPGPGYVETFIAPGFATVTVTDVYANVGSARTQDATMQAGSRTEVTVSAASSRVTINTVDATVGNTLDINAVYDLPIQSRGSLAALLTLQPGVSPAGSVTGARLDQNSITVDGLDTNDIAAGATFGFVGGAPADAIQEFKGTVAGLLPITGTGGGGQFQFITKSGSNSWHGNINEYHRDVSTVANDWFNNNAKVARPNYIRNQFGGNIGGPAWHDKLYFFFNYYGQRISQSSAQNRTVPLDSFRNGNISYILAKDASGNTCTATSRQNTTPQCIGTLNSAQVAALDPQGIGFNQSILKLINTRYPHANDLTQGDGINSGGFRFTTPTPSVLNNYWGRVDFNLTSKQRVFIRGGWNRQDSTQTAINFPGDPVTNPFVDRSYSWVVGHTWQISDSKINQFEYGDNVQVYNFANTYAPLGTTVASLSAFTGPYSSPGSQRRRVPIPVVRDDFNWTVGNHNFSFGGTFKFIKTNSQLVNDFNFVAIGLGGNTPSLNPSLRPADIRTAGTTASTTYDQAFTTALGHIASITSNYNYNNQGQTLAQGTGTIRRYRYFQTELYFGDQWRMTPKFTFDYGVRYQLYSVPYETQGAESVQNTDFNSYFGARLAQSKAGVSGNTTVPFITYNLGGKANDGAPNLYQPNYKDFAPRIGFAYNADKATVFHGSASIVFDRTVINAVNFIQDQSSYLFQNSANRNYGISGDANTSLRNDPRVGANISIPAPPTAPAISKPYTPWVTNGVPNGLAGNQFNEIIDPHLKDPYSIVYTAGFQHEIQGGFVLKMDYVGRLGRRLLAAADASQLVDFIDPRSGQGLGAAFGAMSTQVRNGATADTVIAQPWFENVLPAGVGVANGYRNNTAFIVDNLTSLVSVGDFADTVQQLASAGLIPANVGMASQFAENTFLTNKGSSNYHGLLLTLTKNLSQGLRFDFNYTWSHSIDNASANANFIASSAGNNFICDAQNLRTCRGSSDFDVRHVINANFIYDLPFGRGRAFGNTVPFLVNEVLGGWKISGIPQWRSGLPYSVTTNAFVAGYANNAPAIFNGNYVAVAGSARKRSDGTVNMFTDRTAAAAAFQGPIGFTFGSRNLLRGPSAFQFDAGLAKTFPLMPENRLNLKFRADAFNVLNHPAFNNPNSDITSTNFGQITSTFTSARVAQFSLRLEF